MSCLAMAYVTSQRPAKDPRFFDDDEEKIAYRKYMLKELYNGSEVACYDELRLTKRNFHDLCAMLREKCGLKDSIYVTVEEKVLCSYLLLGMVLK